jgi:hypothetical protein
MMMACGLAVGIIVGAAVIGDDVIGAGVTGDGVDA